jgi:hypothetical protein
MTKVLQAQKGSLFAHLSAATIEKGFIKNLFSFLIAMRRGNKKRRNFMWFRSFRGNKKL